MNHSQMIFEFFIRGDYDEKIIDELVRLVQRIFNADITLSFLKDDPPEHTYSSTRRQYNASRVVTWLLTYRIYTESFIIGILDYDAYVEGLNFVFGIANPFYKVCAVFTKRLRTDNALVFGDRLKKEVMHEIGHLLTLQHCHNDRCVMHFSNTVLDTDHKSWFYCEECIKKLEYKKIWLDIEKTKDL